jgi:hypothetical protein
MPHDVGCPVRVEVRKEVQTGVTEPEADSPLYVDCNWRGNSEATARRHYLKVQERHFQQATAGVSPQCAEDVRRALQGVAGFRRDTCKKTGKGGSASKNAESKIHPRGFEPLTFGSVGDAVISAMRS